MNTGQTRIKALLPDELVVRATFDDPAIFQHENLIGVANGAEPVRDNEGCAADHEPRERLLNEALGGGIHAGGSLVEDQDRRILKQGAGDANALFLANAEPDAALADLGVESVG